MNTNEPLHKTKPKAAAGVSRKRKKPTIETLHRSKTGKSSDKWASYLTVYDRLLQPLRDLPIRLLEIGVQNGGSLDVWSSYFEGATKIVGCDINPRCAKLKYADQHIFVVVGDANTDLAHGKITELSAEYDVVIDDGSHRSDDIVNTFLIYFPLVAPGGTYIVEDTHCLYWDAYQGGVIKLNSGYAFFKLLVDLINYEHWQRDMALPTLFATFFPKTHFPAVLAEGWVDSIEFVNSMIVIRKSLKPGHGKLGERVIVGDDASMVPQTLEIKQALAAQRGESS